MNSIKLLSTTRFDPEGYCRAIAVDQIMNFFGRAIPDKDLVLKVTNTYRTLQFLKEHNLRYCLYVPPVSMLSPFVWRLLMIPGKKVFFNNLAFEQYHQAYPIKAILYHLTCHQLYSIDENWSHCVCEFFKGRQRIYYDSYRKNLKREYPELQHKEPCHQELRKMISVKIAIWDQSLEP